MDRVMFWAAVASPIVGVIAIIVAFIVSNSTTKKIQKQVDAVYDLLDVFVAAQNPTMMEAKKKYEQQLAQLDKQIHAVEEDIQTEHHPFLGMGGPMIEVVDAIQEKLDLCKQHENLTDQRKEVKERLDMIQSYIQKAIKK